MAGLVISGEANRMQVPPDLVSRIAMLAVPSGRSPESFLREAIDQLIEDAVMPLDGSAENSTSFVQPMPRPSMFQPQPLSFSVYE